MLDNIVIEEELSKSPILSKGMQVRDDVITFSY